MSNTINVNYMSGMLNQYSKNVSKKSSVDSTATMSDAIEKASAEKTTESGETAAVKTISREDMTMEEYKQYISDKISSFPLHPTQAGESYAVRISDAGFEAMKNDPEYEKWILDDLKTCFATPVPSWYQAMGGPSRYTVFSYGATKEEFHGQSFPKGVQGSRERFASASDDSFWSRRAESKKQIEAQAQKKAMKKKQMEKELAEMAAKKRYNHQQMMEKYYNEWLANNNMNTSSYDLTSNARTSNMIAGAAISSYEASFVTTDM